MPCPKTDYLMREYFADDLGEMAKQEIDSHLANCSDCQQALDELLAARGGLLAWQDQRVPHWDRGLELFRREHRSVQQPSRWALSWQWLPTAASFAMLALVFLNTTVVAGADGLRLSFGASNSALGVAGLEQELREEINSEIEAVVTRFEARQDANNLQLMQVVMDQTQQTTAANLDRIYSFFEEQRVRDLQAMSVSLQELVDSDYVTMRSIQQLAQRVSYDESIR